MHDDPGARLFDCGGAIVGFGNDAWPVNDDRCCDRCNTERVIPALRLWQCDAKGERGNGGALQMIDLNDIEDDSFFAIHADDLRWLYELWVQLANESRPLNRQAIAAFRRPAGKCRIFLSAMEAGCNDRSEDIGAGRVT